MFPAYSLNETVSPTKKTSDQSKRIEWLKSQSFAQPSDVKLESREEIVKLEDQVKKLKNEEEDRKHKRKHKKKEKKAKKKKKKHTKSSTESDESLSSDDISINLPSVVTAKPDELLCDKTYQDYFSKFTNEELKKCYFYEDLPGLAHRNAFKIDKKGDPNNKCFDSVHFKQLPNYPVPFERNLENKILRSLKKNVSSKKISKKQMRRMIINELKQRRYFVQITKVKPDESSELKQAKSLQQNKPSGTLSDKMWLYLEMKKNLDVNNSDSKQDDKTADFMKYLNENKTDVKKWLEFIEYQSLGKQADLNVIYERQIAIFDKAIKENPESFRLKFELVKLKANSFELNETINSIDTIEAEYLALLFSESSVSNQSLAKMSELDQLKLLTNLFEVWFEMIRFYSTNSSSSLNFNKTRRVYVKFFQYFLASSNKLILKNIKTDLFLNNILIGLDLYCSFLARSGYFEKAVGVYQALLDFNLYTSSSAYPSLDLASRKKLFELFSEIGLPKFGEPLSTGWLNCLENRNGLFEKLETETSLFRYDDYLDTLEEKLLALKSIRIEYRWVEIEQLRSCFNWYPFYPKTAVGESADDCIDSDRLISFDEDLNFILFDLSQESVSTEYFKFKLVCQFFKYLNLIDWNENVADFKLVDHTDDSNLSLSDLINRLTSVTSNLNEDLDYMKYLTSKFNFLNKTSFDLQNVSFLTSFSFLKNMFECLFDTESAYLQLLSEDDRLSRINNLKLLIKNTIDFIRNCISQAYASFSTLKYKTNLTILKWKFELNLILLLSDKSISNELQQDYESYLNPRVIKQKLIDQTKGDLSIESNRTNFTLWKQYALLKWLLNHEKFNFDNKKMTGLKETRKVFDNLLLTLFNSTTPSLTDCVNVYSLCADYVELELGIYYRQFSVETTDLSTQEFDIGFETIQIQSGFFDLSQRELKGNSHLKKEDYVSMSEMLLKNCLNKDLEAKTKVKATFQIGITGSTRLLLIKRDFQNEYAKQLSDLAEKNGNSLTSNEICYLLHKRLYHFHRVYTLFLICVDDIEKVVELNDAILKQTNLLFKSRLIEFYLNILNYYYYQQPRITKHMYRARLFAIIKAMIPLRRTNITCSKSLIRLLEVSLIRFKLKNANLFCSSLLENNDIDTVMKQIGSSLSFNNSSTVWLSLIFSNVSKLERILNSLEHHKQTNIGVHNQIRRQFDQALKLNSRSVQLWVFYLKFELKYAERKDDWYKKRFLYIYYQSIRNLPYSKVGYV